jgi:tetratricopeptide (TPR) repeat protein
MESTHDNSRAEKETQSNRVVRAPDRARPGPAAWVIPALLVFVTVALFLPVLGNGFVDLDDDRTILQNLYYRGLGWTELRWMFTTFYMGHYQPLSWVTLGIDYLLWGMNPFGYHLTNIILHALNALVFYFLCLRLLSLSIPYGSKDFALRLCAGVAAVLFAIHPLRVESVVWATQRRDVLSGLFFLLTLLCYIKGTTAEAKEIYVKWMAVTLGFYILSLLSKAVGMTLPVVLLVLDIYPLRRLGEGEEKWFGPAARKVWLEKIPFVILAFAVAGVALLAQLETGTMESLSNRGLLPRIAQASYGLVFYVWKTIMPLGLSPLYELPADFNPGEWIYVLSALVSILVTCSLFFFRRQWPAGLAVWVYYVAMVAPVSGIVQSGPQLVADRYSYLSCLGWAILPAAGLLYFWERWAASRRITLSAAILVALAGLGLLTSRQALLWRDSETLFRYVLAAAPNSRIANNNLGNILLHRRQSGEAIKFYRKSLEIDPNYPTAHVNLAHALSAEGKTDEAIQEYRQVLRLSGSSAIRVAAYNGLGVIFHQQGKFDDAIENYRAALQLDPAFSLTYLNLGDALIARGEVNQAIVQFRQAIQDTPGLASAHYKLANALLTKGDLSEAIEQYRRTIEIDPKNAEAQTNLGSALGARGEDEEALAHYREALKTNPDYSQAHFNLGILLEEKGRRTEAIDHFRKVVESDSRDAEAHFHLGTLLATEGKVGEAVGEFNETLRIQPGFAQARQGLKQLLPSLQVKNKQTSHPTERSASPK